MRDSGTVTMSARQLDRLEVLGRVIERRQTQRQAAEQLGLNARSGGSAEPWASTARPGSFRPRADVPAIASFPPLSGNTLWASFEAATPTSVRRSPARS